MKKTGMLFPTISQLPCCVYSFTANPRTSRARSAEPLLPATVENRTKAGVFSPARWNRSAAVIVEVALRPEATSVNYTLGDAFVIEVEDLFAKVKIFQRGRASRTHFERIL